MREDTQLFDVVVIGAGPGGYVAAIRAAQLGLSVCCIDDFQIDGKPAPGGTCTNVGCVPSKALLASSCLYETIEQKAIDHGIEVSKPTIDVGKMQARKNSVVRQTNDGLLYLFKKNKIAYLNGRGSFVFADDDGYMINVSEPSNSRLMTKNVIIATGSRPRKLPDVDFDEERILSNTGALSLTKVPKTLGIIGAGVIGLELGSVWKRLGSEVRILEAMPSLLGFADESVSKTAYKVFSSHGLQMEFGVRIDKVENDGKRVSVKYTDKEGKKLEMWVEKLIVSIGRVPYTESLEPANVGLKIDERGFIEINELCQTNLPGVWAIGDCVRGPMLAHKAQEEGRAVAERIAGQIALTNLDLVPSVIYTEPEIAWVGKTEQQLKNEGVSYKVGQFPFAANARARAVGEVTGFVKVLSEQDTDNLLGVHIIGADAGELIGQACQAMAFGASAEDLGLICEPHPSFSEAIKEAALAVNKEAIDI